MVLDSVAKVYGRVGAAVAALDRVSLTVGTGEFVCLVGASGCGKSTLLNLVAGLDQPTAGPGGAPGRRRHADVPGCRPVPVAHRGPQRRAAPPPAGRRARRPARRGPPSCCAWCAWTGFADKRPHELSGGMRQRVALARALAQDRRILLMDEPFGALDAMTRDLLHEELERVWRESDLTVLFVTHNVREAVRLADRVILLSSRPGRIVETYPVSHPPAAPHRVARGGRPGGVDHRPAAGGGGEPWRSLTTGSTGSWRGSTSWSCNCPGPRRWPRRLWRVTWPKLAAIAIGLGLWQLVVWSGWKPTYLLPGPATVFHHLWEDRHAILSGDGHHPAAGRGVLPGALSSARWWPSPSPGSTPSAWRSPPW